MASNLFYDDLNGESYSDMVSKIFELDRSKGSIEDRNKEVEKLLSETHYFRSYLNEVYNPIIGQNDFLSDQNTVFARIESLGTYLLKSDEGKALSDKEKTVPLNTKNLDKKLQKEHIDSDDIESNDNYQFVEFDKSNQVKTKTVKITAKDLKADNYAGEVIREYQKSIDNLRAIRDSAPSYQHSKINKIIYEIKQDQLLAKIELNGIWGLNIHTHDTHAKEYDFDFSDPEQIESFIRAEDVSLENSQDLWIWQQDFKDLVKRTKLNDKQLTIIKLVHEGYTLNELESVLKVSHQRISFQIKEISKKIAKQYMEENE